MWQLEMPKTPSIPARAHPPEASKKWHQKGCLRTNKGQFLDIKKSSDRLGQQPLPRRQRGNRCTLSTYCSAHMELPSLPMIDQSKEDNQNEQSPSQPRYCNKSTHPSGDAVRVHKKTADSEAEPTTQSNTIHKYAQQPTYLIQVAP